MSTDAQPYHGQGILCQSVSQSERNSRIGVCVCSSHSCHRDSLIGLATTIMMSTELNTLARSTATIYSLTHSSPPVLPGWLILVPVQISTVSHADSCVNHGDVTPPISVINHNSPMCAFRWASGTVQLVQPDNLANLVLHFCASQTILEFESENIMFLVSFM